MQSPETSHFKEYSGNNQISPSETEPSMSHRLSNFSSNDLVSPPMSEIENADSQQNLPKLPRNPKFHRNNRDLDLGSDLYSEGISQNRSQPSISTTFLKPRLTPKKSALISDSLPLSQLNFQSIEDTRVNDPNIQGRLEDLIGEIRQARNLKSEKPSILQRQQNFDRLLMEEIEFGFFQNKMLKSEKMLPRIVNFGKEKSEKILPLVKSQKEQKIKPVLISRKYQDRNFPGILCSLIDNVQDPDFGNLAKMNFRRLGDILSPIISNLRITPFKSKEMIKIIKKTQFQKEV